MKKILISISLLFMMNAMAQKFETQSSTDPQGYTYQTVKNDQSGVRVYTLISPRMMTHPESKLISR
jgi:hypothetical protein